MNWESSIDTYTLLISGGLGMQLLGGRLGFPATEWGHVVVVILAIRPVVSDKGPGPLALQKRISKKTESSEASIY